MFYCWGKCVNDLKYPDILPQLLKETIHSTPKRVTKLLSRNYLVRLPIETTMT